MGDAGRRKRLDAMRKSLEATKRAIRRDAENRAYRKAARIADGLGSTAAAERIRWLVKPKIENPGFSIVEY